MTKIKELRKKSGMTQQEFAEKMGVVQGAVSQWESGRRVPSLETLLKIAEVLKVPPQALLENDIPEDDTEWKEISVTQVPQFSEAAFEVPLVASLRCGYNEAGKPVYDIYQNIELPPSYRSRYGEDVVMIKAVGKSMMPSIRPRDMLICKPGSAWTDGNIVVINIDDTDTIKRIYHSKDGGIDLKPDNPEFRVVHFTVDELESIQPHVLGRIVRNMGQDL